MAEHCPLGAGLYWDGRNDIPEFCRENCEEIWQKAALGVPEVDTFAPDCVHPVEYDDECLQHLGGAVRQYSILNHCTEWCGEAFAEEWKFICPKN